MSDDDLNLIDSGRFRRYMDSRVAVLERDMRETRTELRDFKKGQDWLIRLVIGGLILAVMNMVVHH